MKLVVCKKDPWGHSINFVDENNVLVGFEAYQSCCESWGWRIEDDKGEPIEEPLGGGRLRMETDLSDYRFVADRMPELREQTPVIEDDCGGELYFRLVADKKRDRYLVLYNYHSGYYAHGFTFKDGDKILEEGAL